MEIRKGRKEKLFKSSENKRVIKKLVNGKAVNLSSSFDVDLTNNIDTFHVGDTNVDYSTFSINHSPRSLNCQTKTF